MRFPDEIVALLLACTATLACADEGTAASRATAPQSAATPRQGVGSMKILLTINGQVLSATLDDSAAGRDFLSLLPLTLELEDYASTEKIAQLPRKLSTAGAPAGMTPSIGDITYYAPWGNLAIFYKGFTHSKGLVKLGHIDGEIQVLRGSGPLKARIAAGKD